MHGLSGAHTYAHGLGGVELKLSRVTAVDEHGPNHVRWRDGLNVLHQRQLDLLTAAEAKQGEALSKMHTFIFNMYPQTFSDLHHIKKILQVYRGQLRLHVIYLCNSLFEDVAVEWKDTEGLAHVGLQVVQTAAQLPGVRGEARQLKREIEDNNHITETIGK